MNNLVTKSLTHRLNLKGGPCKVDIGPVENGGVNATDGTYLHHGEQIRLTCDEEFEPADAEVKTCVNGQFSPSDDEKPLKCVQTS